MIPCKDCLILPVCKSKRSVRCSLLHTWWIRSYRKVKWDHVRSYLPYITSVNHDEPSTMKYTLMDWEEL